MYGVCIAGRSIKKGRKTKGRLHSKHSYELFEDTFNEVTDQNHFLVLCLNDLPIKMIPANTNGILRS